MSASILYISYDGMLEPLGQSQVLAYLERLAPGRDIHLISFEKPQDWADTERRERISRRIGQAAVHWHPLRYHKKPSALATAYDIALGSARAIAIARRHKVGIVHCRSYVAGLMGLVVKRATGARFLFDMRGFWADERVEGGLWPAGGRLFQAAKRAERSLLLASDHVVTLTHASERELQTWPFLQGRIPPICVIPTCADLDRFTIQGPPQRKPFVLGYVGSVGTWYLLDEMLRCFELLLQVEADARLLIINRGEHKLIQERAAAHAIPTGNIELIGADHHAVPSYISRMSAGLALYRPSSSRVACAPTKLAEYLACGVPCLGSSGVGDMSEILDEEQVGVVLDDLDDDSLRKALLRLIELRRSANIQDRCRSVAMKLFSLDVGVAAYADIYEQLDDRHSKVQR